MKKLCACLLMALLLVPVWAGAESIVLPDPAFYFNQGFEGNIIEFDAYPKAEYDAYVSLLQDAYGMSIVKEEVSTSYELVYLEAPGIADTRTLVGCFTNSQGSGIEFDFGKNVVLNALDEYTPQTKSKIGEIAWDDGRMIADPGDFLGYEVSLIAIEDFTHQDPPHVNFKYEQIPTEDIVRYAEAVDASLYFELVETSNKYSAFAYHYRYTGSSPSVTPSNRNLTVKINNPEQDSSTFYIYEYPGFTINSEAVNPNPAPDDKRDCVFCDNGACKTCGGSGFVYQYAAGYKDVKKKVDCSSCINGRCSFCDGNGWR